MSSWQSPYSITPPETPNVDAVKGLVDKKAGFALDQLYVTKEPVELNGVTQDPLRGTSALLVPSDAHAALPDTPKKMVLAARDAASHLGPPDIEGIPLSAGGALTSALSDVPKSPDDILQTTNLNQVRMDLEKQGTKQALGLLKKLDHIGPFKLTGEAKIHAENDGSATIEADATFPLLNGLSIKANLHADTHGHIELSGLHLHQKTASLGALTLQEIDLDYNSNAGMTVRGAVLIGGSGVRINNFQIDSNGDFQALDLDYLAGPGQGITVGPGLFLTTIGGGLDRPKNLIDAHVVLSAGPTPPGLPPGCPTAGIDGRVFVHFGQPIAFKANAAVSLACIDLAHMVFEAKTSGLVTVDGNAHLDVGPIYADVNIGARIDFSQTQPGVALPPWQVTAGGRGGIRDLLTGDIKAALSNKGLVGCGTVNVKVPLIGSFVSLFTKKKFKIVVGGGAAVHFANDVPPLNIVQLLANIDLFLGCDISDQWLPVGRPPGFRAAAADGEFPFVVPPNSGATAFSIEGAGSAPRIQLRSPKGQVYDFSTAVAQGKSIGHALWGKVLESADKTVVVIGDPAPGTWAAIPVAGSTGVVRVRAAKLLPPPSVRGRVSGHGLNRTLRYRVAPIPNQVVRFVEFVKGGQKVIKTIHTGGHGRVRFTPAESTGTRRTIVGQVTQGRFPRDNVTVAHYVAIGPRVGRARRIRLRRHGHTATVTWRGATLARSYEVRAKSGDGQDILLIPKRGARRVVVPDVSKGEGLRIGIVAISPRGRRGPVAHAKLRGNMELGRVRHLPPRKHKKHKHHR
jgi:hypothetical protein